MTALLYLKFLQFKNGIKQLRYEKSKLFFVIFIAVAAVVSFIPAFLGVNTPDSHASPLHNSRATLLFIILVYLLLYIFVAQSWWAGTQKATLIFRMSDVQFVFTAPLKPQSVLMYGMLNKFQMIMLSSIFIFFQYPNVRHAGLSFGSFLLCILIFLIATFAGSCTGMLIYAASYRNVRIKNFFKTLLLAVMLLIIAIILKAYAVTHDPMEAVRIAFENPVIRFLPIVGWALEIIKGFIGEFGTAAIVSSLLLPGLIAATLKILYSIDINFYEDAISAIGKYEKTIENKKNGKSTIDFKKTSAGKFGIGRGWGESAIMYRMLKSMKREVSNLASMSTIAVLISAGVAIAVIKISGISGAGGTWNRRNYTSVCFGYIFTIFRFYRRVEIRLFFHYTGQQYEETHFCKSADRDKIKLGIFDRNSGICDCRRRDSRFCNRRIYILDRIFICSDGQSVDLLQSAPHGFRSAVQPVFAHNERPASAAGDYNYCRSLSRAQDTLL